ncbi:MAG: tRNA (guanosine(46)-N7)-methyltransferase TrmB [Bacteroidales bacterium]|nr:tRNA (guanosine(46)-N7)-methyltransferase TrmB [Bacteroidales bacterium]MDD4215723.1 tRNA (guanosine(46)-N7)-methyltransferase TrmB [Bacteroidales bacterium]MDY0140330.1 tRNA (guanosine(46)-N7)-methyltransferase TrmB [Bacteroidales bacterium]
MSKKNKLSKFAENKTFPHFFEPTLFYDKIEDFELKAKWNSDFFKNNNPICLELGCGKGEYSVYMAKTDTNKNFIGIDIKGARMWRGAKNAIGYNLKNIAFIRTRVEFTPLCFEKNEIDEIWITFPDPQLGPKNRIKKRLTSPRFLSYYQSFLKNNACINLKTDDTTLYNYTKQVLLVNNLEILVDTDNLYKSKHYVDVLQLKTHYEKLWNSENKDIKYLKFRLPSDQTLLNPANDA